ncbi:MAG: translocation/assembly module TamB domain-containing protein, partial [Planctomycetota bacterium]
MAGYVRAGGRLEFALRGDVAARILLEGRIEGPLAGPPEAWSVRSLSLRAREAYVYGLAVDRLEASDLSGILERVPGEVRLRVRGTAAEPAVTGTVRARSGEVKLATGVFLRIRSGQLEFPAEPGALPRVRFEGEAGSGTASVLVIVDGPLQDPELFLRSEPPRPQQDLLAFLAFGHFPGEVSGGGALGTLALRLYQEQVGARPSAEPRTGL